MYQFDWVSRELWSQEKIKIPARDPESHESIRAAMLLHWQEHCVECALPLCYSYCSLYVPRKDRHCARFTYGIARNRDFSGLLSCGADLRFRRWGKLETVLTGRYLPLSGIRLLDKTERVATAIVGALAGLFSGIDPKRHLHRGYYIIRRFFLENLGRPGIACDEFLIVCYSFQQESCRLIVEVKKESDVLYRESLELTFGLNRFSLRIPLPSIFSRKVEYRMMVYPDNDRELRVAFTWLDFVVHRAPQAATLPASGGHTQVGRQASAAEKVKCVAWDLDNTLWQGTLIEDGKENIQIRPESEQLVRWLDERGILQTVVSKNQHDDAMEVLTRRGLDKFFLYPAINWGPKSENLKQIADRLNINIDTFALIDDSAFERREVAGALPMVRVYSDNNLAELRGLPEFDVPVTDASRMRRNSYLTEMQREKVKEIFGRDHIEFLRSCQLKLRLFRPGSRMEIDRCLELVQRSNQLNLSGRRYSAEQFAALLADRDTLCVAMACEDRFGDYGIVGFASIDLRAERPVARDFVLSCRVAQKHVEHAFYGWLGNRLRQQGATSLSVELVKSARNGPLVRVFEEMPFTVAKSDGDAALLLLNLRDGVDHEGIVAVDDSAFAAEIA
jgi:FkbH-like protein